MPPKSRLGQNFLISQAAQRAIADALGDVSQQTVVEIGPGKGAITDLLAVRARHLVTIELDRTLAPALRTRFLLSNAAAGMDRVQVMQADVLTVDLTGLAAGLTAAPYLAVERGETVIPGADGSLLLPPEHPVQKLAVIGNLPYYITSDILLHLFAHQAVLSRAVLMVQREVADRIVAVPGSSDYGLLSATCQMYARVERLFSLPPEAFSPPPQVHSSVVRLVFAPRFEQLRLEPEGFIAFLRRCFAQKRKTLANNLRAAGYLPADIAQALSTAGLDPLARAEVLSLEEQARVFHALG